MGSTIFSLYFANPSSTYEKETMSSTHHEILQAINADTKIAPECEKYLILVQGKRASKYTIAQDSEGSNAAPLRDLQTSFVCFADLSLTKVATTCNPTLVLFWLQKETDIMKDWFFIHCLDTTDQDKS